MTSLSWKLYGHVLYICLLSDMPCCFLQCGGSPPRIVRRTFQPQHPWYSVQTQTPPRTRRWKAARRANLAWLIDRWVGQLAVEKKSERRYEAMYSSMHLGIMDIWLIPVTGNLFKTDRAWLVEAEAASRKKEAWKGWNCLTLFLIWNGRACFRELVIWDNVGET